MDEKLRILKMVEEGTVTAEKAAELMEAMDLDRGQQTALAKTAYNKKMFRIQVDDITGDKVKIQFPVGAIKKILKATGRLPIPESQLQGVDLADMMEAVSDCLDAEVEGDFINVESADGATVRIFVDQ